MYCKYFGRKCREYGICWICCLKEVNDHTPKRIPVDDQLHEEQADRPLRRDRAGL